MQVVIRNFIKLLSTGAFQLYCTLEEMSEYKWNQLLYIAKINEFNSCPPGTPWNFTPL